ncbi:MAG TPA: histidine phosphatase family protein, partial [Phycisphaerae bacterium]|nr:histidine phosphatase family protein [Phycisphaerae bacterium]
EGNARRLGEKLRGVTFARVFCSPLVRARRTCELAGFDHAAEVDRDLVEWNYGNYEGLTTAVIRQQRPNWDIFRDGCPGGETAAEVAARADRVVAKVRGVEGNTLIFSSSHLLRVLAARWLGREAELGRHFLVGTAALGILGYGHCVADPVIRLWNRCP